MSGSEIPLNRAQLVMLVIISMTYGVYLTTLGTCIRTLLCRRTGTPKQNRLLLATTGTVFVLITLTIVFMVLQDIHVYVSGNGTNGALLDSNASIFFMLQTFFVQSVILIGDGMLIYRCLIIFLQQWNVIILPLLLWLSNLGLSITLMYLSFKLPSLGTFLQDSAVRNVSSAMLSTTLITHLLTTGLITWRLWKVHRETALCASFSNRRPSTLSYVMRIVVESGMLYTAAVLLVCGIQFSDTFELNSVVNLMHVIVGISSNLIIIRMDKARAEGGGSQVASRPPLSIVAPPCFRMSPTAGGAIRSDLERDISAAMYQSGDGPRFPAERHVSILRA